MKKAGLNALPFGVKKGDSSTWRGSDLTTSQIPLPSGKVDWANDLLRYSIALLKGENINAKIGTRILISNILKKRMARDGFWWQVKVLDFWVMRARRGDFGR